MTIEAVLDNVQTERTAKICYDLDGTCVVVSPSSTATPLTFDPDSCVFTAISGQFTVFDSEKDAKAAIDDFGAGREYLICNVHGSYTS